MITNDIPIEGVLKYIKKDRDNYKAKLEKLIPYTKCLEARIKELEEQLKAAMDDADYLSKELKENEVSKNEISEAKSILMENISLRAEIKALKDDYKSSEWFTQMAEKRKRLTEKHRELTKAYNRLLAERHMNNG